MATAFEEMGVLPELSEAVNELGWLLPTDIQKEGIPAILGGADVCMAAETGSGKTGAFCLPVLQIVWEAMRDDKLGKNMHTKTVDNEWNLNVFDRDPSLGVDRSTFTCESTHPKAWSGGRANKGVHGKGKYYYEATIRKDGLCRIGWSTIDADYDLGKCEQGYGCCRARKNSNVNNLDVNGGAFICTCEQGFGYCGTGKRANKNIFDSYGEPFTCNDVIGCFIDLEAGSIHFSKNDKQFPVAFMISKKLTNSSFYPAYVLKNSRLALNFGSKPFAFPPSNGYIAIADAPNEVVQDSLRQGFAQGTVEDDRPPHAPLCVILAPTQELAEQTYSEINIFAKKLTSPKVRSALVTDGIPIQEQLYMINEGVDIISCTPGRLLDLISKNIILLSFVRFFVLDEADSLVSPPQDFTRDINDLLKKIPRFAVGGSVLQIIVCSATLHNERIKRFSETSMYFPQWIYLKARINVAPNTVHQFVCLLDPLKDRNWIFARYGGQILTDGIHAEDNINPTSKDRETLSEGVKILKGEYVIKAIRHFNINQCIIFCRTKLDCDNLEHHIRSQPEGWTCKSLHGNRSLQERTKNLIQFKKGEIRILICTDGVAKGIDVSGVPFVINMTLPPPAQKENYLHQIGRAQRMGLALSFVSTVPEKVWYHKCRERMCDDTRRCSIWFDEFANLSVIEDHIGTNISRIRTDFNIPVDENEGTIVYGQKRQEKSLMHINDMSYGIREYLNDKLACRHTGLGTLTFTSWSPYNQLPKIYFVLYRIFFNNSLLSFKEFGQLACKRTVRNFRASPNSYIYHPNGSKVSILQVLQCLPNIQDFKYFIDDTCSVEIFRKLKTLIFEFRYLNLKFIDLDFTFDMNDFCEFVKEHTTAATMVEITYDDRCKEDLLVSIDNMDSKWKNEAHRGVIEFFDAISDAR